MASKTVNSYTKVPEFEFHKTPNETNWKKFKKGIYNPESAEYFGRTKKSWMQLLIFYTIFYACLAALFAICMQGLDSTLNEKEPKWKLEESLIGTNPGLGFRPISKQTEEGSLIWYNLNKTKTRDKWIKLIDDFLKPYTVSKTGKNYQKCDYDIPLQEGNVCTVDVDSFGPCTRDNYYGYNSSSPCVFLKLNRIYGWVPDFYTEAVKEMDDDLRMNIENARNRSEVWISCKGENPFDKERIGLFEYYPSQGFPKYYFPYINNENYLSPLIAVRIRNVEFSAIVNVECRAWAKNIRYRGNKDNREGSVHFEILIDNY